MFTFVICWGCVVKFVMFRHQKETWTQTQINIYWDVKRRLKWTLELLHEHLQLIICKLLWHPNRGKWRLYSCLYSHFKISISLTWWETSGMLNRHFLVQYCQLFGHQVTNWSSIFSFMSILMTQLCIIVCNFSSLGFLLSWDFRLWSWRRSFTISNIGRFPQFWCHFTTALNKIQQLVAILDTI